MLGWVVQYPTEGFGGYPASPATDSGCYSWPASSFSTDSEPDLHTRRRLSSNADTPDYGSLCSLQVLVPPPHPGS